jgi:hypothetical protein
MFAEPASEGETELHTRRTVFYFILQADNS